MIIQLSPFKFYSLSFRAFADEMDVQPPTVECLAKCWKYCDLKTCVGHDKGGIEEYRLPNTFKQDLESNQVQLVKDKEQRNAPH